MNNEHRFRVHPDESAVWGSCDTCGFTGDGIDILKAKYNVQSIEAVLNRLEKSGAVEDVPRDLILDYQMLKAKRDGWTQFMKEARENLSQHGCDNRVLSHMQASPPFNKDWYDGFGKFAGSARRELLCEMFGLSLNRQANDILILPYYDLPGRIANVRLVSYNSKGLVISDRPTNRSGGLFMLDTVSPSDEYVIAVEDPATACHLQLRQVANSPTTLPIVAWHPATTYWPIAPKRIIFWSPAPSVDTFNQARRLPGAHICTPSTTLDFNAILQERGIKSWVHHVMMGSKPWALALKDTLLGMDEDAAIRFARTLEITPLETGELLFECTHDEKVVLTNILDLRSSVKNCTIGDTKVIERDNAWWTHTDKGRLIQVTNSVFQLEHSANYGSKGSYLVGTVTVGERTERFMAPAEEFMSSPSRWLRRFALQKGMGLIQVTNGWDKRLVSIATTFHPEKIQHIESKAIVGWSDNLSRFSFPSVSLTGGRVDECDLGLPTDNMPCTKVTGHPTQRSVWKQFTDDTLVNRVFWAIAGCAAMNMSSRLLGHDQRKIGVIGQQRSLSTIASVLGLCTEHLGNPSGAQKLNELLVHDVPLCLYPMGGFGQFINWLEGSGVKNVIVPMSYTQATLIGGNDWMFVDARDMHGNITHLKSGTNLIADVVRVLQSNQLPLAQPGAVDDLLCRIHEWGKANKHDAVIDVFHSATKLISQDSVYGSVSQCEAFLYALFAMILDDQVQVSRAKMSGKPGDVEIDTATVRVSKSVLQKMMIPFGATEVSDALVVAKYAAEVTSTDWYITKDRWEEQYDRWLALKN